MVDLNSVFEEVSVSRNEKIAERMEEIASSQSALELMTLAAKMLSTAPLKALLILTTSVFECGRVYGRREVMEEIGGKMVG